MVWAPRGTRGQTPQDFAIGASIMLVTIIGTFAFIQGGVLTTFEEPTSGDVETAADRVGTYVVEEYSVAGERNVLRYNRSDGLHAQLDRDDLSGVKRSAGLETGSERRRAHQLNITIINSSALASSNRTFATDRDHTAAPPPPPRPPRNLAWGDAYRGQEGVASTVRVVTLTNPGNKCQTVCWLYVRVW